MSKISKLDIESAIISITKIEEEDYICLTDMAKAKEGDNRAADVIKNWIRTRTTIEFLGTWEIMYNPNFKVTNLPLIFWNKGRIYGIFKNSWDIIVRKLPKFIPTSHERRWTIFAIRSMICGVKRNAMQSKRNINAMAYIPPNQEYKHSAYTHTLQSIEKNRETN